MTHPVRSGREGDMLAVVSQSGPTVSFFDAADDTLLGVVEVPAEPHELCWDPVRRLLWCSLAYHAGYYHANAGRRTEIVAIDPVARRIVEVVDLFPEHGPHGLALDAQRGLLYVSVEGSDDDARVDDGAGTANAGDSAGGGTGGRSGGVVIVDVTVREVVGRIDTAAPGPHWFAIDAAGRIGVAANKEAPFVSIVDLAAGTMTGKVAVPGSEGVAVSPDGTRAYVAGPYASFTDPGHAAAEPGIRVIDTAAGTVLDTWPTGGVVLPVHLTRGGKLLAGPTWMSRDPDSQIGRHEPGRLLVFDT
ncbi:MAG: YncE family protein, partial [Catenulispora sp.]|nr:YncE family protein [Catenulispora sp.]